MTHAPNDKPMVQQYILQSLMTSLSPVHWNTPLKLMEHLQKVWWYYIDNHPGQRIKWPVFCDELAKLMGWTPRQVERYRFKFRSSLRFRDRSGGVLISPDFRYTFLIQGSKAGMWWFPSGKIEHEEKREHCAQREVLEETGFNVRSLTHYKRFRDLYFQSHFNNECRIFLFFFTDVPTDFPFQPQCPQEIKNGKWVLIDDLLNNKHMDFSEYRDQFAQVLRSVKERRATLE